MSDYRYIVGEMEKLERKLVNQKKSYQGKIDELEKKLEKAVGCIEFYADKNNYSKWGWLHIDGDPKPDCDKEYQGHDGKRDVWNVTGGKLARTILKELGELGE